MNCVCVLGACIFNRNVQKNCQETYIKKGECGHADKKLFEAKVMYEFVQSF